jgi:hypothetical protein
VVGIGVAAVTVVDVAVAAVVAIAALVAIEGKWGFVGDLVKRLAPRP